MRWLYILLFLLTGLLYWYLATNHCDCGSDEDAPVEKVIEAVAPIPMKKLSPIGFSCSNSTPSYEARWEAYKDSLVNSLQDNQILEIMGYDYVDESAIDGISLGQARASNVRSGFNLSDDKVRVLSQSRQDSCQKAETYNMIRFRTLRNSTKIKEVGDRTLIYFPVNSTNKLADADIEAYLDDVAASVKASGAKIQLTGHTDSTGNRAANIRLGQGRADVIKAYLVAQGVPATQIMTSSSGPDSPIADNATEEGRAQNRRTELQIIQ